ncbi:hypothetical protein CAL12_23495 [Bordetella genomosp. 8]|uniref:Nitroreductase domain-containing protein n=2 Tax=Bordetella genomosp. 8 TaxID=1416806 RepID=A0A1W6YQV9_9BORD|nr:hypothetical protein CAL12_23495 [Bordetella genomosp. 8]
MCSKGMYHWHAIKIYFNSRPRNIPGSPFMNTDISPRVAPMAAGDDALAAGFHAVVAARRSIYAYAQTPVPRRLVEAAIADAIQAPNHHRTEPWRFHVFAGEGRARLAAAYEAAASRVDRDVAKAIQRAYDAPVMIVAVCMPAMGNPKVSQAEERYAVAAAVQTMMLSFAASGVDTLLTTGELAESPEVRALLGLEGSDAQLMGVINVGYRDPERPARPRPPMNPAAFTTWCEAS